MLGNNMILNFSNQFQVFPMFRKSVFQMLGKSVFKLSKYLFQIGELKCLDPRKIVSPPQELTYLAMSTYWFLARGLGLNPNETGVTPHFSLSQFLDATEKLCNLPATDERLKKLEENAPSACYQCLLMYHLLTDGFHFDEKSWDQLHVAKRLNGMELGWGLGRAILHSDMTVEGPEYIR